jgi:4-amino-4-deoxy-L-arabinose transferase-like glycosyltransferase
LRSKTSDWAIAGLIAALALAVRAYGLNWGLPEVYEEAIPFKRAWEMWGWGPGRHLDLNPHFFRYPSLTIYLQFLGQGALYLVLRLFGAVRSSLDLRVMYELDKTWFYLVGRGITALMGAATVLPTFFLARRVAGRTAAVAAALLVALNTPLVGKSQGIEVDVPLTLFVTLGCLLAVRLAEQPTWRNALAGGLVTGLATASKYTGLALLLPMLAALAFATRDRARAGLPAPATAGRAPRPAARRKPARPPRAKPPNGAEPQSGGAGAGSLVRVLGCLLLGLVVAVAVTSPFLLLDSGSLRRDVGMEQEHMALGHFGTGQGPAWAFYARVWATDLVGWPLALATVAGLVYLLAIRRRPWAVILGSLILPYYLLVGSWSMKADRYLLPLIPAGIVIAVAMVAQAAADRPAGRAPAWAGSAAVSVAAIVFGLPLLAWYPNHLARLGPDTRTLARAWIEANVPQGAFLATEEYGPDLFDPLRMASLDRDLIAAFKQRRYQPRLYAVQKIPMFQVTAERSAAFYDPGLYQVADYVIVTGAVRDRYRADPARFARQLGFYAALQRQFAKAQEFSARGAAGTDITIYRNPAHTQVFAARRADPGPVPTLAPDTEPSGGEAFFFYNLGLNYEVFGFVSEAIRAYAQSLQFITLEPQVHVKAALRMAGCLARQGKAAEAAALLDQVAARAPSPGDAAPLHQMRARILGGGR